MLIACERLLAGDGQQRGGALHVVLEQRLQQLHAARAVRGLSDQGLQ